MQEHKSLARERGGEVKALRTRDALGRYGCGRKKSPVDDDDDDDVGGGDDRRT
jgi:hypothetical protein